MMTALALILPGSRRRVSGFTLLELLVSMGIILILAAIAFPVFATIKARSNQTVVLENLRQISAAALTYASQNDSVLPEEDGEGIESWQIAADPRNEKVWYNVLPRMLGRRGVGDYAASPREFYTPDNLLFVKGAEYPESDKKLTEPSFAIAINGRLQRKVEGSKEPLRLPQITNPARTALFFEQGLKSEKKSLPVQSKYDGGPKGTARSFVARYGGKGVISFVDGHAELFHPRELLTETGLLPFPQTDVIWSKSPEENPN